MHCLLLHSLSFQILKLRWRCRDKGDSTADGAYAVTAHRWFLWQPPESRFFLKLLVLESSRYPWSASGQLIWILASMPPFTGTLLWHRAHVAEMIGWQSYNVWCRAVLLKLEGVSVHNSEVLSLSANDFTVGLSSKQCRGTVDIQEEMFPLCYCYSYLSTQQYTS